MIRLIAVAAFALAVASSAQAAPIAPIQQADSMVTLVRAACGVDRTRINGVCVVSPPNGKSADARCGASGAFAIGGVETPPRYRTLA
jgi:hypothetical protein